jgi:hypothetical protein
LGLDADPVPETVVQVPLSLSLGVLAARVAVVTLHRSWSTPASEVVGRESTVIVTSDVVTAHPPLAVVMVHLNTDVSPTVSPVTPDVGSLMSVTIADPDSTDQPAESVPDGVLAANVAVIILQRFWSGPAAAMVPDESTLIVTSLNVGAQPPNSEAIVQRNTEENPMVSPVIPELRLLGEVITADPDTTVHVPFSLSLVVFPAKVVVVIPQRFWSGPASAIVVVESTLMTTSSKEGTHPPNPDVIVH